MTYYIKNINLLDCIICNSFSDLTKISVKMLDLTESENGKLLELVYGRSLSHQNSRTAWFFRVLPCQGPRRNSRSKENPPTTGVILARLPNLQTETDVHYSALWEEEIGLLHAAKVTAELNQHLNSPVSTKIVLRELNKRKADIMEEPPSRNFCFHYQHSKEVAVA